MRLYPSFDCLTKAPLGVVLAVTALVGDWNLYYVSKVSVQGRTLMGILYLVPPGVLGAAFLLALLEVDKRKRLLAFYEHAQIGRQCRAWGIIVAMVLGAVSLASSICMPTLLAALYRTELVLFICTWEAEARTSRLVKYGQLLRKYGHLREKRIAIGLVRNFWSGQAFTSGLMTYAGWVQYLAYRHVITNPLELAFSFALGGVVFFELIVLPFLYFPAKKSVRDLQRAESYC